MSRRGRRHDEREQRHLEEALMAGPLLGQSGGGGAKPTITFRHQQFPSAQSHCELLPDPDGPPGSLMVVVIGGTDPMTTLARDLFVSTHGASTPEECMDKAIDFFEKSDARKNEVIKQRQEKARAEAEAAQKTPEQPPAPGEQVTEGGIVLP